MCRSLLTIDFPVNVSFEADPPRIAFPDSFPTRVLVMIRGTRLLTPARSSLTKKYGTLKQIFKTEITNSKNNIGCSSKFFLEESVVNVNAPRITDQGLDV
jgi:hypothetical protein